MMLTPAGSAVGVGATALALWNTAFVLTRGGEVWGPIALAALVLDGLVLAACPGLRRPGRPTRRLIAVGLAATAVQIAATYLVYPRLAAVTAALEPAVRALYTAMGPPRLLYLSTLLPLVAASEELVFRGALQSGLQPRLGAPLAVGVAAIVYAASHVGSGSVLLVALAGACGVFWGALRAKTGSLWPGFLCHLLWDLVVLFAFPLVRA